MSAQAWVQVAGLAVGFVGAVLATPKAFAPKKIEKARNGINRAAQAVQRFVSKEHLKELLPAVALGLFLLWLIVQVFFYVSGGVIGVILVVLGLTAPGMAVAAGVIWAVGSILFWLGRLFEAGTADENAFLRVGGAFIAFGVILAIIGTAWPVSSTSSASSSRKENGLPSESHPLNALFVPIPVVVGR